MIMEYNRTSLRFGIPGALLQFPGPFLIEYFWPQIDLLPKCVAGLGSILLLIGLSYYARAKGPRALGDLRADVAYPID